MKKKIKIDTWDNCWYEFTQIVLKKELKSILFFPGENKLELSFKNVSWSLIIKKDGTWTLE